jgi:transposase
MDLRKRSATIEVIDERARVVAAGRYGTDTAGYAQMLVEACKFADRLRAEGYNGVHRHLAHRPPTSHQPLTRVGQPQL